MVIRCNYWVFIQLDNRMFKHIFCIPIFAAYFHTSSRLCLRVLSGCVFFPSLSTAISQRRMKESAILLVVAFRSTSWNLRACAPVFFFLSCVRLCLQKKQKEWSNRLEAAGFTPKTLHRIFGHSAWRGLKLLHSAMRVKLVDFPTTSMKWVGVFFDVSLYSAEPTIEL